MNDVSPPPSVDLDEFVEGLRGPALRPGDLGYEDARMVMNGLIDRKPAVIAQCSGVADVISAVNFAKDHDVPLSVRGGGHNVAGNAVNDGGVVVDLSHMRGVRVDPQARTARVQGGATWGDVDRETQVFGLATPGGLVSTTGVAGLTLHGGMGHLRRPYGLSLDNVLSVDIVTADGQLRVASAAENPDLFWAIRGAGSNFGVVTSFEFQLHPVGPTVMLGAALYSLDDGPRVLRGWRSLLSNSPEALTPLAVLWSVPEGFPAEIVGRPVVITAGVYAGSVEEGEEAVRPFRSLAEPLLDMSGPMPFAAVQSAFDAFFPKGLLQYWKSTYVDELSDELLDALCQLAASRPSSRTTLDIWPMTGAASRVAPGDTAFGTRRPYMIAFESTWTNARDNETNIAWARDGCDSMSRFSSSGIYANFQGFAEGSLDTVRAAYGENFDRLSKLKAKYDPTNLFHMNLNIPPQQVA
jgi:FAD binding domain/Berberine and berberine like